MRIAPLAALVLAVAAVLAPLAARADPTAQPASAPAGAQPAASASADLAYYPPAARAAGTEGKATLTCQRNEHLALKDCQLVSESPAGAGFGVAALAMAAKSPDNPRLDFTDPKQHPPITVDVRFSLHPPGVTPDISEMGHTVAQPSLVTGPTRAQIQAAYPVRALSDGIDGVALIDCLVNETGKLGQCQVAGEDPAGYGFGAAALELAADYVLKPGQIDGAPVGGAEVRVPVPFDINDPDAPLELKTQPAP